MKLEALLKTVFLAVLISFTGCEKEEMDVQGVDAKAVINAPGGGKAPAVETVGNNLSFPVVWAEGIEKTLRTPPVGYLESDLVLTGEWWYIWGPEPIDPQSTIYSCAPSPADEFLCLDQTEPGTLDPGLYRAYVQKDAGNYWEAYNAAATEAVNIDFVDWGDNLESIDWSIKSKVRTELVLYEVMDSPELQYPMRHVSGWGTDEVHGLQTDLTGQVVFDNAPGDQATVYSTHARMTIQKLNTERENPMLSQLDWDKESSQWIDHGADEPLINEPIFSKAIYEAGDGPEYFSAEVNVKGKIIYGYTWDMKKLNEGTGDYRITYSFDETATGSTGLNTFITEWTDFVPVPVEEEGVVIITGEGESGGTAVLDAVHNLTYMDVRVVGKTTGGGGGNSGGGNGGGGNNSGGGGSGGNSGSGGSGGSGGRN